MIEIRPLQTHDEMRQAEEVQRLAWGIDDLEITSVHMLHALQHAGAALLGAFDGERLMGFCLGVLGADTAVPLKMYSAMTGVLPAYQSQNVGYRLKLAQREFALKMGVRLVTWTYDPLESRNAYFNIGKLGAVCRTYHLHFHGDLGGINAGLPTDRFEVAWHLADGHVEQRLQEGVRPFSLPPLLQSGARLVNETTFNDVGLPVPPSDTAVSDDAEILVEIPADIQAIKQQDFALAQQWRLHTRTLFTQFFAAGYVVTDFFSTPSPLRSFYVLTR
ncbi:MAG: hypothetical protein H6662_04295 [Ardenticatenaceae bacterium]|nr:hypothetical protein [Ardenticatenaceae bacterium]MCB8989743.1 hypothetical protein [Ardenticatenaceae bacterium]MCB9002798.1 hypothetical protein [Ardenticatenaceae bacterium]